MGEGQGAGCGRDTARSIHNMPKQILKIINKQSDEFHLAPCVAMTPGHLNQVKLTLRCRFKNSEMRQQEDIYSQIHNTFQEFFNSQIIPLYEVKQGLYLAATWPERATKLLFLLAESTFFNELRFYELVHIQMQAFPAGAGHKT